MTKTLLEPVPDNKDKYIEAEKTSDKNDEIEELKIFIEKKKIQNVALKKIIEKLNTDKNHTSNK